MVRTLAGSTRYGTAVPQSVGAQRQRPEGRAAKLRVIPPSPLSLTERARISSPNTNAYHTLTPFFPKEAAELIGGWKDQEGRTAGDDYGVHYETFVAELKTAIDKI